MSTHIKLTGVLMAVLICFGFMPSFAFADSSLQASDYALMSGASSVNADKTYVEASIIDPIEEGIAYDLYMQWSDDSPEGLGKYHWDKVNLAVYVDEAGIRYYFVTNPDPDKAASELMCTLVWLPKSAKDGVLHIPGHVQLVASTDGGTQEIGEVREVVSIGYSGGSKYGEAQDEKNLLPYWYAKDSGDSLLNKNVSGANNTIYKDGSGSAKASAVCIPASIKTIGDTCFYDCAELCSVVIEEGSVLEEIGWRAFLGTSINSITLPETVSVLGGPKYYRVGENQSGAIVDYDNKDLGKYATDATCQTPVSSLDERVATGSNEGQVFTNCRKLTSVALPSGIKTIGVGAFSGCSLLENVIGLEACEFEYFGKSMFANDAMLTSFTWPASLKEIPDSTFSGSGLTAFVIPASVEAIGSNVFMQCDSLASIDVEDGNDNFTVENGILYTNDFAKIIAIPNGLKEIVIHDGYTGELNLNSYRNVVKVVYPDSVSSAGSFQWCSALKEVVFGKGITTLPGRCFANCTSLESVTLACSGNVGFDSWSIFPGATNLKRIVFTGDVGTITIAECSRPKYPVFQSLAEKQIDLYFLGDCSSVTINDLEISGTTQPSVTTYFNGNVIRNVYVRDVASASEDLKKWCECGADFKRAADADSDFSKGLLGIASASEMSAVCSAALSSDAGIVYDATAKTPAVTVTPLDSSVTLAEGTDYEVTYSDNVNVGTAKAIIKGLGAYYACEPLEVEFTIEPADISKAVVAEIPDQTLAVGEDGAAAACEPQVSASITLVEGSDPVALTADDFDVSYADNILPGTATVTLTGKGNYQGTATATFAIVASDEDKAAAVSAESVIAEKLAAATDEGIASCDEAALSAVADALEAYNGLTEVQKTQVGGSTASALIAAQQKVADAKEKAAAEALAAAEAERDQKAQEAAEAKAQAEQLAKEADEAKAQAEQLKADVAAAKASAAAGAKLAKPALTAKTKSKKKGKVTVAWSKVAGASGYELKVGKKTYTVKGAAKASKTVKAKKGKKVKVQVRAFKAQGDNTVYSAWSKAKKVKVKK